MTDFNGNLENLRVTFLGGQGPGKPALSSSYPQPGSLGHALESGGRDVTLDVGAGTDANSNGDAEASHSSSLSRFTLSNPRASPIHLSQQQQQQHRHTHTSTHAIAHSSVIDVHTASLTHASSPLCGSGASMRGMLACQCYCIRVCVHLCVHMCVFMCSSLCD